MQTESATRDWRVRWRLFSSEVIGTAALVCGGLSLVIVMFGDGSPMGRIVPNERLRMALTAFLFGCVGTAVTLIFLGFRHLRPYTPYVIPFLYAVMVPLESHISGTSTNPAIEVAKLYHFESDRRRLFHRMAGTT